MYAERQLEDSKINFEVLRISFENFKFLIEKKPKKKY